MPAPKPKIEFPDPDKHVDLVTLRKEIRNTILDLRPLMRKGEDQTILVEFSTVIHPGSFHDPGRLPRDSVNGRTKSKRKEECLFAAISAMIQTYWDLVLNPDDPNYELKLAYVQGGIAALKELKDRGLSESKVVGDDRSGYRLVR